MGKARQNNKELKKQAVKTPKEKRAAKQVKKLVSDSAPIVVH